MPLPPAADLIALVQCSGPEVLDAYAGLEQQRNGQWR